MEEEKFKISSIYKYAKKYLIDWFPDLPSYQAFDNRLIVLSGVFAPLICLLLRDVNRHGIHLDFSLIDSMPIQRCSHKRAGKVAPNLIDNSPCKK